MQLSKWCKMEKKYPLKSGVGICTVGSRISLWKCSAATSGHEYSGWQRVLSARFARLRRQNLVLKWCVAERAKIFLSRVTITKLQLMAAATAQASRWQRLLLTSYNLAVDERLHAFQRADGTADH